MGAGISRKSLRDRIYRRLKNRQWKLKQRGIETTYKDLILTGKNFTVFYAVSHASNGEVAGWETLRFSPSGNPDPYKKKEGDIDFSDFHIRDIAESSKGNIEAGIQRILAG